LVKELHKTGLTDKEALIYVTLIELGGAYPSRISEYSGLKRATTYNILATLSVRGLINEIEKKNKLFYQIDKPTKLIKYSNTRIQLAKENLERTERILPDIESLFSMIGNKPKVLFFEGTDTVLSICNDMVSGEGNYEMMAFSNAKKFKNFLVKNELRDFIKAKERLNISTRAIAPNTNEDKSYNDDVFKGIKKELWPKLKYISEDKFPYEAEITIYGTNKVSITKLGGPNIIGVIIEDKIIHDMMRMVFELSWGNAELKN
jgi:sugar-specific transcriptional regulator TrmB